MFQFLKKSKKSVSPLAGSTSPMPVSTDSSTTTKPVYKGNCDSKHWASIQFAFKSGNRNFFCWNQDIMVAWERMEAAKSIYRELEYHINPGVLSLHFETVETLLKNPKVKNEDKLFKIAEINSRMKELQGLSIDIDTQIRLATVKFFDEYEDPFKFDYKYNVEKVKFWASNNDVATFFLNLPQNQYLTSSTELQENLMNSLKAISVLNIKNMEYHSTLMNSENISQDLQKELDLHKELEQTLKAWSDVPITNTI
jgi:hypothetical protein